MPDRQDAAAARDRDAALYDAQEYLVAGLENQAEWWEHLGDAHRDYAALARAVEALQTEIERLRGFPRFQLSWEDVEIALRAVLDDDNAVDAAMCLKNLDWVVVRDA